MKKIMEVYVCDICKRKDSTVTPINYPVVFHTEQTEGRSVNPYISQQKIDVCDDCLCTICKLDGYGAQGHNDYRIK